MANRKKIRYTRASQVDDTIMADEVSEKKDELLTEEEEVGQKGLVASGDAEQSNVSGAEKWDPECSGVDDDSVEVYSQQGILMRVVDGYDGSWTPPPGFGKPLVFKAKGQLLRCFKRNGNWRFGRLLTTLATGWFPRAAAEQVEQFNKYILTRRRSEANYDYVECDTQVPPWVPLEMSEIGACLRLRYTATIGVYLICKCPSTGKVFAAISSDRFNEVHIARIVVGEEKVYFAARPMDEFETIKDLVAFFQHQSVSSMWNVRCITPFKTTCVASFCVFGNYIKPSRFDDNEGGFETGKLPDSGGEEVLQMSTDDIVVIVSKRTPKPDWWYGHINTRFGLFHNNRVEEIGALSNDNVIQALNRQGKLWCVQQ